MALLLGLLLISGLVAQGLWVFYRERKTVVTLHYEAAVAPRGPGKGQVSGCRHMASNAQGELFYLQGVGTDIVLQKFGRDGQWLAWAGPESKGDEKPAHAFAVAGDNAGGVWMVERGPGLLKHYDAKLKLLKSFPMPGTDLSGVAVGPDQKVWAVNFGGQLYSLAPGATEPEVFTGKGKGRLRSPYRMTIDPDGNLYVLDFAEGPGKDPMVLSYDAKGAFLKAWKVKDDPSNEFLCISWHPLGYVVINDARPDVVEAKGFRFYTKEGKLEGMGTLSDGGHNLRAIPGFAIAPNGVWYMDFTPLQQGCARLSWTPPLKD